MRVVLSGRSFHSAKLTRNVPWDIGPKIFNTLISKSVIDSRLLMTCISSFGWAELGKLLKVFRSSNAALCLVHRA